MSAYISVHDVTFLKMLGFIVVSYAKPDEKYVVFLKRGYPLKGVKKQREILKEASYLQRFRCFCYQFRLILQEPRRSCYTNC